MKTLTVFTTVTATVREEWRVTVNDADAAAILADPILALDALAGNDIEADAEHIRDTTLGDETDREIEEVIEAGA